MTWALAVSDRNSPQANLRRKKTTSAQTAVSFHKLDVGNQRHEKRQQDQQTDSSKEMNTE